MRTIAAICFSVLICAAGVAPDTFTGLAFLLSFDCHILVNTPGSLTQTTK